jgi:CubicO group peptidase (beta-lactamase class C family)
MNRLIKYGLILTLACISCEREETESLDVDNEILAEIETLGIPSLVACILDTNGIKWQGIYGYANKEHAISATDETIYSLQSISKLFLSIATFQLYEAGKLDLEADINLYLPYPVRNPYYPDSAITVSMLLNHSSGLAHPEDNEDIPDFHHFYYDREPPLIGDWVPEYILPSGSQYRSFVWKDFPPGTIWLYSNIGTSLLAVVLEEISEMDYRDYCRQYIFDPLGMDQTTLYLSELDYDLIATPYYDINGPMYYFSCRHYPAGFINTNLTDFAKFVEACLQYGEFEGGRLLKKESFEEMLIIKNRQSGIANLWDNYTDGGFGHIGGGTGFSTVAEWHPGHNYAFFILTNRMNNAVYHHGRLYELVKYQAIRRNGM